MLSFLGREFDRSIIAAHEICPVGKLRFPWPIGWAALDARKAGCAASSEKTLHAHHGESRKAGFPFELHIGRDAFQRGGNKVDSATCDDDLAAAPEQVEGQLAFAACAKPSLVISRGQGEGLRFHFVLVARDDISRPGKAAIVVILKHHATIAVPAVDSQFVRVAQREPQHRVCGPRSAQTGSALERSQATPIVLNFLDVQRYYRRYHQLNRMQ